MSGQPRRAGPYLLEEVLGSGGGGVVYAARTEGGERVALKRLDASKHEPGSWARFQREIRIQSQLSDAGGFVPVLETGEDAAGPWVALRFMAGGSLRDRLTREGKLSSPEVWRLGNALAAALGRAHERGFVHRDLKPENLLFDGEGEVFVADLGIARLQAGDRELGFSRSLSLTGELRGTLGYLAPECVNDSKHVTPRADVFSLGCVLYESASGRPVLEGSTSLELLAKLGSGRLDPLREVAPDLDAGLREVIERCLALDPAQRFATGAEVAAALADARPGRVSKTTLLVSAGLLGALSALILYLVLSAWARLLEG